MKYILLFCALFYACDAFAQVSPSMQDAAYLATLRAVLDYKMEDEKNAEKIWPIRRNAVILHPLFESDSQQTAWRGG